MRGVVARLLAAGVDPRAERNDGRTPLHSALRHDAATDRDIVSALVRGGGADNLTPLQLAAVQGDAVTVTSLLAEGDDPNTVDSYGWNALHFAVPVAGSEVVSTLLEREPIRMQSPSWQDHSAARGKGAVQSSRTLRTHRGGRRPEPARWPKMDTASLRGLEEA